MLKPPCSDCGAKRYVTGQIHWQDGLERRRCDKCLDALRRALIAKTRKEYGWPVTAARP